MGAGRTELLQTIFGLHPRATGEIWATGGRWESDHRLAGDRRGLALAPEDRKAEGSCWS